MNRIANSATLLFWLTRRPCESLFHSPSMYNLPPPAGGTGRDHIRNTDARMSRREDIQCTGPLACQCPWPLPVPPQGTRSSPRRLGGSRAAGGWCYGKCCQTLAPTIHACPVTSIYSASFFSFQVILSHLQADFLEYVEH